MKKLQLKLLHAIMLRGAESAPPGLRRLMAILTKMYFIKVSCIATYRNSQCISDHVLNPIISRGTVKMNYSCLPNMGNIIKRKNNNLLKEGQEVPPSCNCTPGNCPVDGKCSLKGVIYQATLKTKDNETHKYVDLTDNPFI